MWRSVIIHNGERLATRQEWLVLEFADGSKKELPLEDLYCIVIDNPELSITMPFLSKLAQYQIHLITTNEKHLPISETFPINAHYKCYKVIKQQIEMTKEFKGEIWERITRIKINNQATVLENNYADKTVVTRMRELAMETVPHDLGNREGIAAKMFFRNLYGSEFVRFSDDKINVAMNYGYAIMRSCVAKTLISYGFNCAIGVHHISETNEFNLADDFMEPTRALVDAWVVQNIDLLEEGLNKTSKACLVDLINTIVRFDGSLVKLRYALDMMVRSMVTSIETNNTNRFLLPELISIRND